MFYFRFIFSCGLALLLAACGSNITPVTGVTLANFRYTGAAGVLTVKLVGEALTASGVRVYANGASCQNDNSTSETNRSAYCVLTIPDNLKVAIRVANSSNEDNFNAVFTAPMPQVRFTTRIGNAASSEDFVIELNPISAPITVKNFLAYVNESPSFYESTIFHRVDKSAGVVQGGGFTAGTVAKTGLKASIALESNNGLLNLRGSVGMARTTDVNSATSQFYINMRDNPLYNYTSDSNPGYAVFGSVISGMSTLENIYNQETHLIANVSAPINDITIISASQTQ
jgi:cyclophilin family peptidyl-prolyl cis-trans isomerase